MTTWQSSLVIQGSFSICLSFMMFLLFYFCLSS